MDAIVSPKPKNVTELRASLSLFNYYAKFISHLASILQSLNNILKKGTKWEWSDQAVKIATEELISSRVLIHFNPSLPIQSAMDASQYGLGAVLSHVCKDGMDRPIAFASRPLSSAEKNYSQIEKEGLSIFGIKRFNQYLMGREFTLITAFNCHFWPKTGIPPLTAARMQCWALLLLAYSYKILYRSTKAHGNADTLSHLPLHSIEDEYIYFEGGSTIFNMCQIDTLPVTVSHLQSATRTDIVLSNVLHYTLNGWPQMVFEELKPFFSSCNELTVECNCLMWGIRVIVPTKLKQKVLQELHISHFGITK